MTGLYEHYDDETGLDLLWDSSQHQPTGMGEGEYRSLITLIRNLADPGARDRMAARLADRGEILDDGTVHPFDAAQAHLWALWLIERHGPRVPGASDAWTGPDGIVNILAHPDDDACGKAAAAARASGQPILRVWFADPGEPPHRMTLARA